ncbi:hypothetical protein [Metabacillus endolithicus]|uniref:Uncharacterized protein n=1 Tax=Metabacillus endolithicus TaxID=1535204 RepID=A0ABW5BTZ3_9BACI|nr:hypothetical protein [Metabacillus endolithicus]UPG63664.1 hypothetical protein MVE64_00300 [Metabacillus endolithicus]
MSEYKGDIRNYGDDVSDLEVSPFEHLRMLYDRTELHKVQDKLNYEDKVQLAYYDVILLQNAEKMVENISKVYDFNQSTEIPLEQWWWHLDKMIKGDINFGISSEMGKVI